MNKIKALIFDLDGTIGNTLPLCIKAFKHSLEPILERRVTDSEIIERFGPSEEGMIMALVPNHYKKGIADYLFHYEAFHNICPAPFEGIKELLDILKENNVRLSMVTGKGKHSAKISLNRFKLENYFEMIETGSPNGPRKPEGIQNVINRFNEFSKNEIIYVGDAPGDIRASRQVGIPVVAAAWAETAEKEKLMELEPDEIFHTIIDFAKWISHRI